MHFTPCYVPQAFHKCYHHKYLNKSFSLGTFKITSLIPWYTQTQAKRFDKGCAVDHITYFHVWLVLKYAARDASWLAVLLHTKLTSSTMTILGQKAISHHYNSRRQCLSCNWVVTAKVSGGRMFVPIIRSNVFTLLLKLTRFGDWVFHNSFKSKSMYCI